jgi:ubiquitin-protein ligase
MNQNGRVRFISEPRFEIRLGKELAEAASESARRTALRRSQRNECARAALALATARHPRLGATSPARKLPPSFFQSVFEALHLDREEISLERVERGVVLARVPGPEGSPYQGGIFHFAIFLPDSYPMTCPRVKLLTRMFSAGVAESGENPWNFIPELDWSLAMRLPHVLLELEVKFGDEMGLNGRFAANVDRCSVMDPAKAQLWNDNPEEYERLAREWTQRYATKEQVDARPLRG